MHCGTRLPETHREGRLCYISVCRQPWRIETSGVFPGSPSLLGKHGGEKKTSELFFPPYGSLLYKFGVFVFCFVLVFLNWTNEKRGHVPEDSLRTDPQTQNVPIQDGDLPSRGGDGPCHPSL